MRERETRDREKKACSPPRLTKPKKKRAKTENFLLLQSPPPFLRRFGIVIKNEGTPPPRSHGQGGGCGSRFARAGVVSFVVAGGGVRCCGCSNRSASFRFRFRFRSFFLFFRLVRRRSLSAVDVDDYVGARVVGRGQQASLEAEAKADAEAAAAANDDTAAANAAAAADDASNRGLRLADALPFPLGDPASFDVPSREF